MSSISTTPSRIHDVDSSVDDQEELSDIPLTPREGWTSLIALSVMVATVALAIDDSFWVGPIGTTGVSQTGFLPVCGVLAVLVGTALAKSRLGRYQGHVVGALIGAAFVLNAVAASVSTLPSIEGRLHALNLSLSRWVEDVFVIGAHSTETSIFLIVLGALMWGAGQFGAYAVFRRHRPLPAVVLLGFMLLVNVSITIEDQYLHVIVFMAASLVLLIRLNLLDQAHEWRSRGMRDVGDISQSFMRNGATFVVIAVIAATTLAANASSAPLSRFWRNIDDDLLEVGYAINRYMGGITGSARGPSLMFTRSQQISGKWESSDQLVFTASSNDPDGSYWRGATYDSFDGVEWSQLETNSYVVEPSAHLLDVTSEPVDKEAGRKVVSVTVTPADYGGNVIVSPEAPVTSLQQMAVQTSGQNGPFVAAELTAGIEPNVPYTVTSSVRETSGPRQLTGNQLASAGITYPDWIQRYLEIRPGSLGELAQQTADQILASLPPDKRDPYHATDAVWRYLFKDGDFQYNADVQGLCDDPSQSVDCLLKTKQGYCMYFATTMVMLLREMGVPARYVSGYLPGQHEPDGSWRVERSAAHAWAEVYFPTYGWVKWDPTPGLLGQNGQEVTDLPEGSPVTPQSSIGPVGPARDPPVCAGPLDEQCLDNGGVLPPAPQAPPPPPPDNGWGGVIAVLAVIAGLVALAALAIVRRVPTTEPELAYRGVTKLATRLGYGPRPSQTAYEFAAGLGELVPVAQSDLALIATAKVEATYGRKNPEDKMRKSLGMAYRRVRLGLLRLMVRRPKLGLRPRSPR
jgi:transglutaminase-like putative cysteine protease